jgi:hypothetical protein
MSREADVAALLTVDVTLMAILTGGIFVYGNVGPEGISRGSESTATAFDADGYLLPCALVKQRGEIPTNDMVDYGEQMSSARQIVEIWYYQDTGYAALDSARARVRALLQGVTLSDSFELKLVNTQDRLRDPGALAGASMAKQDWQVDFILT